MTGFLSVASDLANTRIRSPHERSVNHLTEHDQGSGLNFDRALRVTSSTSAANTLLLASNIASRIGCIAAGVALPCWICV